MTIPLQAAAWQQPLDPTDQVDFIADFAGESPLLEEGEEIVTYLVELMPEAVLLGIEVDDTAPRAPTLINTNTAIRIWLSVPDPDDREQPEFAESGTRVGIAFTITTNSDPSRRLQRTFAATVRQL